MFALLVCQKKCPRKGPNESSVGQEKTPAPGAVVLPVVTIPEIDAADPATRPARGVASELLELAAIDAANQWPEAAKLLLLLGSPMSDKQRQRVNAKLRALSEFIAGFSGR